MPEAINRGSRDTLLTLAERCERATGPDRELDGLIEVARNPGRETILYNEPGPFPQKAVRGPVSELQLNAKDLAEYISAPAYTASLDAAMTLVSICPKTGGNRYAVMLDSGFYGAGAELWHKCSLKRFRGHAGGQHEGLPRALCAAALKARALASTEGEQT